MSVVQYLAQTQELTRDGYCCKHLHVRVRRYEGMLWWSNTIDIELNGVCSLCQRELEQRICRGEAAVVKRRGKLEVDEMCHLHARKGEPALSTGNDVSSTSPWPDSLGDSERRADELVRRAQAEAVASQRDATREMHVAVQARLDAASLSSQSPLQKIAAAAAGLIGESEKRSAVRNVRPPDPPMPLLLEPPMASSPQ